MSDERRAGAATAISMRTAFLGLLASVHAFQLAVQHPASALRVAQPRMAAEAVASPAASAAAIKAERYVATNRFRVKAGRGMPQRGEPDP